MTLFEQRLSAVQNEAKKPVTKKSARANLIACGVLLENGEVAPHYRDFFVYKNGTKNGRVSKKS